MVLRLQILKTVMLSNFVFGRMLKKYDKSSISHICAVIEMR